MILGRKGKRLVKTIVFFLIIFIIIVIVKFIISNNTLSESHISKWNIKYNYSLSGENEIGEKEIIECSDDEKDWIQNDKYAIEIKIENFDKNSNYILKYTVKNKQ